jgi:hypothetical protein
MSLDSDFGDMEVGTQHLDSRVLNAIYNNISSPGFDEGCLLEESKLYALRAGPPGLNSTCLDLICLDLKASSERSWQGCSCSQSSCIRFRCAPPGYEKAGLTPIFKIVCAPKKEMDKFPRPHRFAGLEAKSS